MLYRLTIAALVASAGAFNAPMTQVDASLRRSQTLLCADALWVPATAALWQPWQRPRSPSLQPFLSFLRHAPRQRTRRCALTAGRSPRAQTRSSHLARPTAARTGMVVMDEVEDKVKGIIAEQASDHPRSRQNRSVSPCSRLTTRPSLAACALHPRQPRPPRPRRPHRPPVPSLQLGVEAGSVTPTSSFTEDLGADSLDAVELIMAIEEAFDIEIPDEEAESMTTPAECVASIKTKLG